MSDLPQKAPNSPIEAQKAEAIRRRVHDLLDWGVVAEKIGVDRKTVHRWRQTPAFKAALAEEIARLDADSRELRQLGEAIAWIGLIEVAGDTGHRDRVKACDSILDRVGHVRGSKITVDATVAALPPTELAERRQRALARLRARLDEE